MPQQFAVVGRFDFLTYEFYVVIAVVADGCESRDHFGQRHDPITQPRAVLFMVDRRLSVGQMDDRDPPGEFGKQI